MKQFLLISNTTEKNIDNNILNYLSKKFEEISFKMFFLALRASLQPNN